MLKESWGCGAGCLPVSLWTASTTRGLFAYSAVSPHRLGGFTTKAIIQIKVFMTIYNHGLRVKIVRPASYDSGFKKTSLVDLLQKTPTGARACTIIIGRLLLRSSLG